MSPEEEIISLPRRKIRSILRDPAKTAEAIKLVYVSDIQEGIRRLRKGSSFEYFLGDRKVKDKGTLGRIKSLVIPPAWENVWICKFSEGHLQATGLDVKN